MTSNHIPIQNIYYLLCYAWDALPQKEWVNVGSLPTTRLIDLFASVLSTGLERLVRQGYDRGYLSTADETRLLRGKIQFDESIRNGSIFLGVLSCEHDDLLPNVLHNQIIKTTMENLSRTEGLSEHLKIKLMDQLATLKDVDSISLAHHYFRRVQLHRNTRDYAFLLNVCELIFERLLVDENSGQHWFKEFEQDEKLMNRLFEKFVRNFYRREQSSFYVGSLKFSWPADALSIGGSVFLPEMRSDVCLFNSERQIILDCKYYRSPFPVSYGKKIVRSEHIYQIFSYVKNKEVDPDWRQCEGVLLYATVDDSVTLSFETHGHRFRVQTINLNQDWLMIERDLLELLES